MFSRPDRLIQRTPKDGVGRFDFLKQLVRELRTTQSLNAKQQVIANLANFAYDPINYKFLRSLKVINIFLDQLSENDIVSSRFALAGICNIVVDPEHCEYLIASNGIDAVIRCLNSTDDSVLLSAITILIYTLKPSSKNDHIPSHAVERLKYFSNGTNIRFRNLAHICLQNLQTFANETSAC